MSLNVWHVSEVERYELSNSSYGQFHSDDVYIIRWRYKLVASGNTYDNYRFYRFFFH